jgi:CheY-like chemotaxis protein
MARVLVVDDESNIRKAVGQLLQSEGFETDFAADGDEALEVMAMEKPDLVLLDMFMPKVSGRALCEMIRKDPKLKGVKVIFLTVALLSEAGKGELKALKISDYVTKPFDNDDLVKRINKALNS